MKKIFVGGLVMLLALSLAAGLMLRQSSAEEAVDTRPVVGYVELLSESSWRDQTSRSITDAVTQAGMQVLVEQSGRSLENQIQTVRKLITYQVDAIVFSPVVMAGWENVLAEAQAAGIPVVLFERQTDRKAAELVTAYVGTDYRGQGHAAADFIQRAFQDQEEVYIMELLGGVGSSSIADRSYGIRTLFGQDEKYKIFYSVNCDMMLSKAKETCRPFFKNGQLPDVLISHNDAMTYGVIELMEELGIRPGEDVVIVSFDGEARAVELLAEGKISCEIETDPNVGPAVAEAVGAAIAGQAPAAGELMPFEVFLPAAPPASGERGY